MRIKIKLLTIGILALLLCATVPIAATATQPEKTTINAKVYLGVVYYIWVGGQDIMYVTLSQKSIGQITIDTVSGDWVLSCHKVPSDILRGPRTALGIAQGDGSNPAGLVPVPVNNHGYVSAKGNFGEDTIDEIQETLSEGGVFFISASIGLPGLG